MLRGIYGDPERYQETYWSRFPGRYFAGDGAKLDDDGYLWLLGRVDDVMNVSGHRISTTEVESALVDHPKVAEAAVVGAKDDTDRPGDHRLRHRQGRHGDDRRAGRGAAPARGQRRSARSADRRRSIFTDDLPKTRSGKIMRRLLRDVAEGRELGDTTTLADPGVVEEIRTARPARPPKSERRPPSRPVGERADRGRRGGRRDAGRQPGAGHAHAELGCRSRLVLPGPARHRCAAMHRERVVRPADRGHRARRLGSLGRRAAPGSSWTGCTSIGSTGISSGSRRPGRRAAPVRVALHHQVGHPFGFVTPTYPGEVALGRMLADPTGRLTELQQAAGVYPPALRDAFAAWLWEADFDIEIAAKAVDRADTAYVAGLSCSAP